MSAWNPLSTSPWHWLCAAPSPPCPPCPPAPWQRWHTPSSAGYPFWRLWSIAFSGGTPTKLPAPRQLQEALLTCHFKTLGFLGAQDLSAWLVSTLSFPVNYELIRKKDFDLFIFCVQTAAQYLLHRGTQAVFAWNLNYWLNQRIMGVHLILCIFKYLYANITHIG